LKDQLPVVISIEEFVHGFRRVFQSLINFHGVLDLPFLKPIQHRSDGVGASVNSKFVILEIPIGMRTKRH
jgi:hypothetical protein